jgi:hypothetical protein
MVFNATILIYENTHSKMTQMKNANITAAPQLLSLAEFNFNTHVHISGIYMLHDTAPNGDYHKIIANSHESVLRDTLSMKQVH